MNQHSESDPEQELNASVFYNYVNAIFNAVYKQWQQTQQFCYNLNITLLSDQLAPPLSMYLLIDSQTLASIVAQMIT